MQLLDFPHGFKPVLKILTDYPRDDLAHDEVHQSLVTACVRHGVEPFNLDVGAIPGLDTVTAGFKTAQLALNSALGYGHIFHSNCAPRKNIVSVKSLGEKVVLGITSSGVTLLIVNAGYALAPFYEMAQAGEISFYQTSIRDAGSQFRSRDYFPDAMGELAAHLVARAKTLGKEKIKSFIKDKYYAEIFAGLSFIGEPLPLSALPQMVQGAVMYVDNFGNIKLNFRHEDMLKLYPAGTVLAVRLGHSVCDAVVGDVGFSQSEGTLALTSGSSGWDAGVGHKAFFTEMFLRGGRAESYFKNFKTGDGVLALRETDLLKVVEILQGADRATSDRLDLYNISEAKIIEWLAWAKLIRNGFDTTELQKALQQGTLLDHFKG